MKKFLLVIIIFFCCINVNALERKFTGYDTIGNVMYYKENGGVYYFRMAKEIRDVSTDTTAYCLEPFIELNEQAVYSTSNNQLGLSDEMWNKVKLIAYYGYGYKNHTDKKWITITQMTIWRTLYPQNRFEWVDPETRMPLRPYEKEIKELNTLVNNHNVLPDIPKDTKTSIKTKIELKDSNNVLNNYVIVKSDFDSKIENNTLIVNTQEEQEGEIILQRAGNIHKNDQLTLIGLGSQSLIEIGNITPIDYDVKIHVESGEIKITKVDKETDLIEPQGEASLDGAVYEIYDSNMNFLQDSTIKDNTALFDNLKYGKYFIKEKSSGDGYYVDNETYEINIDENNINQKIRLGNIAIKSKITIVKKYGSLEEYNNDNMQREKDITFNIYDKNEELVFTGTTDENGEIKLELPYGEYIIRQVNTTEGYTKIDDYKLVIGKDNNVSETIVFNDFKVIVPNAGVGMNNLILRLICLRLFSFLY